MGKKISELIKTTYINIKETKELDYKTWIFSSSYNNKYNYNSKYLFEYVLKNSNSITPLFIINDNNLRSKLQDKYGKEYFIETNSIEGIKKVLNSGVWIFSAGLPLYGMGFKNKRLVINLWHGIPLKRIGLKENKVSFVRKQYFKYIFSNNYTHILTTSKELVPLMAQSFGVSNDLIYVWGQPRNDNLFIANDSNLVYEFYSNLPSFSKLILYAPTFRDENNTKFFPFNDFNLNELNEFLEENNLIIFIRCHQFEKASANEMIGDRIKLINDDLVEDIMEILNIFDLLITDYSSIYLDYLLVERPILFLPYDKEEYLKYRGMNFKYNEVTPGPKPKTFIEFKEEIKQLLSDENYYKYDREKNNLYFNEINEPCSENIYNHIKDEINKLSK